eukprot:6184685-Pleurochrysis_carterae.AAC.3
MVFEGGGRRCDAGRGGKCNGSTERGRVRAKVCRPKQGVGGRPCYRKREGARGTCFDEMARLLHRAPSATLKMQAGDTNNAAGTCSQMMQPNDEPNKQPGGQPDKQLVKHMIKQAECRAVRTAESVADSTAA